MHGPNPEIVNIIKILITILNPIQYTYDCCTQGRHGEFELSIKKFYLVQENRTERNRKDSNENVKIKFHAEDQNCQIGNF